MNTKIYQKVQQLIKEHPMAMIDKSQLTKLVSGIFDVDIHDFDMTNMNTIRLTEEIDEKVLEKYFSKIWQPQTKKYKYSGLAIVDEANSLKPRRVLDIGCGYNEFKGKINNLVGIDPYNSRADVNCTILDYQPENKFDLVISYGSINFGSTDKILNEISKALSITAPGGYLYFRVNPGKMHDKPEAKWIDFFEWTPEFIMTISQFFGCEILSMHPDADRLYFVLRKRAIKG
jgi:SAM-dependent methyltransferase